MPILWRLLLSHFFKIVFFCVLAFVSILLTMRLDDIAHFAALGAPLSYILLFTFFQIPYILPIALPISCLIAALILVQRLSSSHELTALRACGFSIKNILMPILLAAALLSFCNFWMVSEIATRSHLTTNLLKNDMRSINPLLLLNNKHLMRLKGIYFDGLGPSKVGESASQVVLVVPNSHQQRLNLLVADLLRSTSEVFIGQGVTFVSSLDAAQEDGYDHLLIENMEESITSTEDFSQLLQKKVWTVNNDYLSTKLLLIRIEEQKMALKKGEDEHLDRAQIKQLKAAFNRSRSEITRRVSMALAPFTFTLMGAAFGINISRRKSRKLIYLPIILTTFFLTAFFTAKAADQYLYLASLLYSIPHLLIIVISLLVLKRVEKGIE